MEMKRKIITRPCSCRCCMLVIEKTMWEDGDVDYDISLQDSHFDHNYHTLWGRLKRAAKALFGKPVSYSDVYLWKESEFRQLVDEMDAMAQERFAPEEKSA